ncbi:hypothetical protein [Curtobacterium sp. ISL-83]|uniref:hypothetical protein n=1 Tax=Curtobacterium sp. ISL-83 TaxID=2819145 RepID=UPI001BE90F15|nr:hypothetical protein [Curtobacterium sp. ISL-83]MBT2504239.1 hypothetical protein [Curtobacterium sp. ISL-83]
MITKSYVETVRDRVTERGIECTDQHIIECLKYLAIMSGTTGRRIVVTPDVDEVWHEFIVQTRAYGALCSDLPGKRFIHHESISPDAYATRIGDTEFVDEFLRWVPDYVHSFGPFTEERARHWTVTEFLRSELGMTLADINAAGRSASPEAEVPRDSHWRVLEADDLERLLVS